MRNWLLVSYVTFGGVFLCSCASEKTVTVERAEATGLAKYESDVSYEMSEDGSVQPNSDKRSSLESVGNYSNIRQQSGSSFNTEAYSKKGWSQSKSYEAGAYQGGGSGSNFRKEPHFAQQRATGQGQAAHVAGQGYESGAFYGGSQTVSRGEVQDRTANSATQVEQDSFVPPPVKSHKEDQQLSVDETNWMLGR